MTYGSIETLFSFSVEDKEKVKEIKRDAHKIISFFSTITQQG
jgi:hypothetical protein